MTIVLSDYIYENVVIIELLAIKGIVTGIWFDI